MAYNDNQSEFPLPASGKEPRRSAEHLPRFFRTNVNKNFLNATMDQMIQPGVAEKINSFYGRRNAKAREASDGYVSEVSSDRENYQLEPATVIKDDLGNVNFYNDYIDYINQIKTLGGNTDDHSILNREEFYAWNPNIDWDKFSNFREYYWLPTGPQIVSITGTTIDVESTIDVALKDNVDNYTYTLSPYGTNNNPTIKLYRGVTYVFNINTPSFPFTIKSSRTTDEDFNISNGLTGQNTEEGILTFTPTAETPDTLYYVSKDDVEVGGLIKVANIEEASFIDVEEEILGKTKYTTADGFDLSNGMKIEFLGEVTPAKYAIGAWYVEGVGSSIELVSEGDLNIPAEFTSDLKLEFDETGFDDLPFDEAIGYPANKDYIIVNRSSKDGNLWSRYNRWFHKDVIEKSAEINAQPISVDQSQRANRPIIEFVPNLKLFKFGTKFKKNVDLIDTFTQDVFSTIEGTTGYNIDQIDVVDGMRILFTADNDPRVNNRIYKVQFINFNNERRIALREEDDTESLENENVLVTNGVKNKGKIYYYSNDVWNEAQAKSKLNQAPLYEIFDKNGNSFADKTVYEASTFAGNKIFSYTEGTGANDAVLGFPISYQAVENVGDISFTFDLLNQTFNYQIDNTLYSKKSDTGFLRKYSDIDTFTYVNGWTKVDESNQPVIRQYIYDLSQENFLIDQYVNSAEDANMWIKVYKNNKLQFKDTDYTVETVLEDFAIKFKKDLELNDNIVIKTRSYKPKVTEIGHYEIAANLEKNPLNDDLLYFTLGEVNDHVGTIVENSDTFSGQYPGTSNLRDLGDLTDHGRKFLKHSSPTNLPLYHLIDDSSNVVDSIRYARKEYTKFKRTFLQVANDLGFTGDVKIHVDKILTEVNKGKLNSDPFYFSDMLAFRASKVNRYTVENASSQFFALSEVFDLDTMTEKAVQIYLNGTQLVHGKDYTFNSEGFAVITATKEEDDVITIYEYETTNGSFIPPTPTKLGLFPAYEPVKYQDDTFIEPTNVIQGHDGSITVAYDDFRDDLILELEKRIYNNLKVKYDDTLWDIHTIVGGANRDTKVSKTSLDNTLVTDFIEWQTKVDFDYTKNNWFDRDNGFTFNYSLSQGPDDKALPGHWRQAYIKFYDTDRPHTHPWEMLGFSVKPSWWEDQYGPAPYTRGNLVLWKDLEAGIIREPNKLYKIVKKYARPGLTSWLPVDTAGNLVPPSENGLAKEILPFAIKANFVFGDGGPAESAWRRSSAYPFALMVSAVLNQPGKTFATAFDRSRQKRNLANQIVYGDTETFIKLENLKFPNTINDEERIFTSGIIDYVVNFMASYVTASYTDYKNNVKTIKNQIGFRVGAYTDKAKFRLILDARNPLNEGNVFVPEENYNIIFNTSTPVKLCTYSGVIVEKQSYGYVIRGYDQTTPYFNYYKPISLDKDPLINVGGVSTNFVTWASGRNYTSGAVVEFGDAYYRVTEAHQSGASFDESKFAKLPRLPLTGGKEAFLRKSFQNTLSQINYGHVFLEVQEVVDFLLGYGEYQKEQGFVFDYYDGENKVIRDWTTSVREYLFWLTQGWSAGTVIALSPGATNLKLISEYSVADGVYGGPFGYSILKADGKKLNEEYLSHGRSDTNTYQISTKNTADGIYLIKIPLVQKEHVCLIDNKTVFNDTIYAPSTGYRQERIKVLGYRTDGWNGSYNIPGFIYDNVTVTDWAAYKDYAIGDVVRYKEFYYTATYKIPGTQTFDSNQWKRLDEKPEPKLIPNMEYKSNQFADFYDLDSDNFDVEQQRLAQHLIGYQKRQYLENIINDDVSQYKFYQGMIQDKGTANSLTKLFDALGSANQDSLDFYEEFAIRDGNYGAIDGFTEFELNLDENKFRLEPQPIEMVDTIDQNATDLVYRVRPFEVYTKNDTYTSDNALPAKTVLDTYVNTAGFVNNADINAIVTNYDLLVNLSWNDVDANDYVWVGDVNREWNVYKIKKTNYIIEKLESTDDGFKIFVNATPKDINENDVIGLYDVQDQEKFFKVSNIKLNEISFEVDENVDDIETLNGRIAIFEPQRVEDLVEANILAQNTKIDKNDLMWIDKGSEDGWQVLKNENHFELIQDIQSTLDSPDFEYATAIATDGRNVLMAVGSPAEENGVVRIYYRSSNIGNFNLVEIIPAPKNISATGMRFGESIDISKDGKFMIVGSPNASNVKTKFLGDYEQATNYDQGDIVKNNEILWEAVDDILGAVDAIQFNSFASVTSIDQDLNITAQTSEDIPIILTGNYPFQSQDTDHILLRAPKAQYDGSGIGDTIKLRFNEKTFSNQDQTTLTSTLPFNGIYPQITKTFLESGLTVVKKIDAVLYVDASNNIPELGDRVDTTGVFGTVDYVYADGARVTIYLKDVNGVFAEEGSLFLNDGRFVGEYELQGPNDDTNNVDDYYAGYWYINIGDTLSVTNNISDDAKGLVYIDVVPSGESDPNRKYYNIRDYDNDTLSSENAINSYIRILSYQGSPGEGGSTDPFLSNKYVIRAPKAFTDTASPGDDFELFINQIPNFDTGNPVKDISTLGLSTTTTNDSQTIYDIWDGYIQFDNTKADADGNPFEPRVGIIVQDVTTGATAEVTYYQRDLNVVTIFVKNVTGDWSQGDDYGDNAEIKFIGVPTDPDPVYQVDRVMGQVQYRALGLASQGIGKLLVLESGSNLPVVDDPIITDAEYWIYEVGTVDGIPRPASIPKSDNNDWREVFKLRATEQGTASTFTNEGAYHIFSRTGTSNFSLEGSYVIPDRKTNNYLGTKVKLATNDDLYRGYIHARDEQVEDEYGKIYFVKQGTENNNSYSWELAKNKDFRGAFDETIPYFTGEKVYLDGSIYTAKTNIVAKPFEGADWTSTDDLIDYVGFIPNDTGLSVRTDSTDGSTILDDGFLTKFGNDFDVSDNGEVLVTTAEYTNDKPNLVVIYRVYQGHYQWAQQITAPDKTSKFGTSINISADGMMIAVGESYNDDRARDQGKVYIYKQNINGVFELVQELYSPGNEMAELYGSNVKFDGNILAVSAYNADSFEKTTFDGTSVGNENATTLFDQGFTEFKTVDSDSGVVYVYDRIADNLVYAQTLSYKDSKVDFFGRNLYLRDNHVYVGLPRYSYDDSTKNGIVADFRMKQNSSMYVPVRKQKASVDVNKIKQVALYDKNTKEVIAFLDYIDPLQGKIAGPAEQNISFKTKYDPATYTNSANTKLNVDNTNSWGEEQVGKLWWNIGSCKFTNPYQDNVLYSTTHWNEVYGEDTVEVAEWVGTTLTPSQWTAKADTTSGLATGISGALLYDNDTYSTRRVYDKASGTFTTKYYFWVTGKKTIPEFIEGRTISSFDVARLIEDPAGQNYRFLSLISPNSFALNNCASLIRDTDVVLGIEYYTIDNQNINTHNQFRLLTVGDENSKPSADIERKWFDSLVGYDEYNRPVPDPQLPEKNRYGVLNRPRQGWFVNRVEALKQYVERANRVFDQHLIVENKDISDLFNKDNIPAKITNTYDTEVDDETDLQFVGVAKAERAEISVVVEDGKIIRTNITKAGRGYLRPPTVKVSGQGKDAELSTTIDNQGRVVSVSIDNAGINYKQETTIATVRRYSVLVKADSALQGRWSIYERITETRSWQRIKSQSYDTTSYWTYKDWYASGYNQFTNIDYLIDQSYELEGLDDQIGDIVKISSIGTGGWLLLRKVDDENTVDYTVNYETIGRQNGTINLLPNLYDLSSNLTGFDDLSFDIKFFDSQPIVELRTIITAVKEKLLVDDLAVEYNKLFFSSLKYVYSEQLYIDWAFKTSFIKAKHNVGELREDITYNNDSLPSFENYVNEVKPYKTKIREFLSSYEKIDPSNSMISDFDLSPRFNEDTQSIEPQSIKVVDDVLTGVNTSLDTYPNKNWIDNLGFGIKEVIVANPGKGYTQNPIITLTSSTGTGAKLQAYVGNNGKLTSVKVLESGSGYLSAPTYTINGSQLEDSEDATLSIVLGNSAVRAMHTVVKFDRVSSTYQITKMNEQETFTSTGNQQSYTLVWPIDLQPSQTEVIVDNIQLLSSEYTVTNVKDTSKGYDRYFGKISFTTPLVSGKSVVINYKKNLVLLSASERINLYYDPKTGQAGKDLGQLMDGVDYGGVEVRSFGFSGTTGWGSAPWYTDAWDTYDTTYEDEVFTLDGSTISLELSKPFEDDVVYNIYKNGVRIDDPEWDGSTITANENAIMQSITGDGVSRTLELQELGVSTQADDVIIVRKESSDGSFINDPDSYDTIIEGGNLAYSTASGLNAQDITVDGDGFVTPTTSKGPEEVVPGQLLDALDIKVYERPADGSSEIYMQTYIGDGSTTTYDLVRLPLFKEGLFVKVDYDIVDANDYTINYANKTITFDTAPANAEQINFAVMGTSGKNILDVDEFTADGTSTDFLTNVKWKEDISYFATVDGVVLDSVIVESDASYTKPNNVIIRFAEPPANGTIIKFGIFEGQVQNYSQTSIDTFEIDGSSLSYTLSKTPFTRKPFAFQTIVTVNDTVLNAGYLQRFTMEEDVTEYQLDLTQAPVASLNSEQLKVFIEDTELQFVTQWSFIGAGAFDPALQPQQQSGSAIVIAADLIEAGKTITVYVVDDGDYAFGYFNSDGDWVDTPDTIYLDEAYNEFDVLKVYQFSNHDSQGIERQSVDVVERTTTTVGTDLWYKARHTRNGLVILDTPAQNQENVWVIKNRTLLTLGADYNVTDNGKYIKLLTPPADNDTIEIIHFAAKPHLNKFGWKQFKDMLNRNHYKKLESSDIELENALNYYDKTIVLNDASDLPSPPAGTKTPGIIFIEGERIEYFIKDGNTLKQIRRGTLGTGVKEQYEAGTSVYNQSADYNMPYRDETKTIIFDGDGTSTEFTLDFNVDDFTLNSNQSASDLFEVFVAGKRLRKNSVSSYRFEYTADGETISSIAQDSPEGDVTLAAEFTVSGNTLTLSQPAGENQKVIVVRKTGRRWTTPGTPLIQAENDISRFLQTSTVDLPR